MNVVSMKKKLLEGEFPGNTGNSIKLTEKQIKYLAATVPCVRIHDKNTTQYYFPEASTYLAVHYYGGMGRCDINGSLYKVSHDDPLFQYEDGIRKFPINKDKKPLVFNYPKGHSEIDQLSSALQRALWLNKMPYEVKIEGYESIFKKGWPKNTNFGGLKTSLSIPDGDFETVYLTHEEIFTRHGHGSYLKEAILNGEFDGSESVEGFEERVTDKAQKSHEAITYRLKFEQFIKNGPLQEINKDIEIFNDEIDTYKKFLKMATELRRMMKKNPELFKKAKKLETNHGMKSSSLFNEMMCIDIRKKARRRVIISNNQMLHYKIERAVKD